MSLMQEKIVRDEDLDTEAAIFNIQRYSTEDGPGIRTTVFMKGCPLRCPCCQNPEGLSKEPSLVWYSIRCIAALECVKACKEGALNLTSGGMGIEREKCTKCGKCVEACPSGALEIVGKTYTIDELLDEILKDRVFYDKSGGGVTFGGGEPVMQTGFLEKILPELKCKGIHVAIDTCGALPWKYFKRIIKYVDLFLYDLKLLDEEGFKKLGGSLGLVLDNAKRISHHEIPMWVRTPIIPGYTDNEENIKHISEFIYKNIPTVERYDLLAFNNMCKSKYERLNMDWKLKDLHLVETKKMEGLKMVAEDVGLDNVRWSGLTKVEAD